jgi:phospholipase/lecithinase/hemolysin
MKRIAAILGVVLGLMTGAAQAVPSNMFVFGDSLMDTGNLYIATTAAGSPTPPSPPYFNGRFSNGPLFDELIAGTYGITLTPSLLGGNNFSWAGAQTGTGVSSGFIPNVQTQINSYLTSRSGIADPNAVYWIEGGGNDVLPASQSANVPAAIAGIVNNIVTEILTLYGSGADNFVIVNVPNVGATPRVQALGPDAAAGATAIAMGINQGLLQALTIFRGADPTLNLQLLDFFALGNTVAANPLAYGFTNTTAPCLTETTLCPNPDQYLYWDSFHPTAAVGRLVASFYIPEPSTLLLLLLPIAAIGFSKRKST